MLPRAGDDEEYEYVHDAVTGVTSPGGQDELAAVILALTGEVTKLCVLLQECPESEFKAILPRLSIFRSIVNQMPTKAKPARKIGFKASDKPKSRKRKSHE